VNCGPPLFVFHCDGRRDAAGRQEATMAEDRTWWETIKVEGGELLERVRDLIREGNVRRIIIRQGDRSVAEFPLTVGVVGTVAAPILAAVGALAALLTNCTIEVQRTAPAAAPPEPPASGSSTSTPDADATDRPATS
jgi:hypothetical protein